jgi:ribosomal protein S20
MPILKNAKKALRASQRKAVINGRVRSKLKTMVDKVVETKSPESLGLAFSAIDKAKNRNLIQANKAARFKSQLNKLVQTK